MELEIRIRPFKQGDEVFINALRQNDDMESLLTAAHLWVSLERETKWVEDIIYGDNKNRMYWAVTTKDSDDMIGYFSIISIDYRNGTCASGGIKVSPEYQGRGLGLQISLKQVQLAFEELRMVRIIRMCLEEHQVSYRLMEKTGFKIEGLMRKYVYKKGEYKNVWLWSMTDDDYREVKKIHNL